MRIVCAESVTLGGTIFGELGEVVIVPDAEMCPAVLEGAEALIVRSTVKVGPDLLEGTGIRFVGTATAGIDHLDIPYLEGRDIVWSGAPGSNANGVAEYVVASLLCLALRHGLVLSQLTLGIVGVGHVGSAVERMAKALGMRVLLNDPPRELAGDRPDFVSLEAVLRGADIVTLHVPLNRDGPFRTRHLAALRFFETIQPGAFLLNSCRGEVVDTDALLSAMEGGVVRGAVLDVWEPEPAFRLDALERVDIGTPHVAGYSHEGKLRGTLQLYDAACGFFGHEKTFNAQPHLVPEGGEAVKLDGRGLPEEDLLSRAVRAAYEIEEDDRRLRAAASPDEEVRMQNFRSLRKNYRERREFPATRLQTRHVDDDVLAKLVCLGFQVEAAR